MKISGILLQPSSSNTTDDIKCRVPSPEHTTKVLSKAGLDNEPIKFTDFTNYSDLLGFAMPIMEK